MVPVAGATVPGSNTCSIVHAAENVKRILTFFRLLFPWFYHISMGMVVLVLLRLLGVRPPTTLRRGTSLCIVGGVAALLLSGLNLRFAAQGILFHGGVFLAVASFLIFQQRINGKRRLLLTVVLGVLAALTLFVGIDGLFIEPTALRVDYYSFTTPKISRPIRIAFLADFQADQIGEYERRTLTLLKEQKADLILFGGDYVQARSKEHEEQLLAEFNALYRSLEISAPLGVYAVKGNLDHHSWTGWSQLFENCGVFKANNTITLNVGEVRLTLLNVHASFAPYRRRPSNPKGKFHIMAGHAPCFSLDTPKVDLLFAGHTHGGQVRIPGFGPIITLSQGLPRSWASGKTTLENGATLIVANGTGMERGRAPRIRLFCPPNFVVVDLLPE